MPYGICVISVVLVKIALILISVDYLIFNNFLTMPKQKYTFSQCLKEQYPFIMQISGLNDKLR